MGIRREIVREQIASYRNVLRNRLTVIAGDPRREVLWRFNAARSRLNGVSGSETGAPGRPGFASSKSLWMKTFSAGSGEVQAV
jgi:hypothetical protein